MSVHPRRLQAGVLRGLTFTDAALNRLYGWKGNPLYQSGTIAVALLGILIVTGLWLILFYRVGAPYESVARIQADPWIGRWVRAVHRYASALVLVATLVHMVRMFAQGRSWEPRALAWVSGVFLLLLLSATALTGYVMVWDAFGQLVAQEGARMLDVLPILSEPISRAFTGEQELLGAFFFLNLFAHIAIPLGMALVLWLHVSRVARPTLLPPRMVTIAIAASLVLIAIAWPLKMEPEASAFRLPERVTIDLFYAFWLPFARRLPPGAALAAMLSVVVLLMLVPVMARRRGASAPQPSHVEEDICVGCRQCALDCPYDAITMVARTSGDRSEEVARVDPERCASCGICSASCAPMGVGPPGRTGRDQLTRVRAFIAEPGFRRARAVVVGCDRGVPGWEYTLDAEGAVVYPVDCIGNVHTSVIELLLRAGARGVLVLSCPPRDCWNREGPRWLFERVYHDREAELKARVDRRRLRVAYANRNERGEALKALRLLLAEVAPLDDGVGDRDLEVDLECEPIVAGTE